MADDADSKSVGGNTVWVQVPPPAPSRAWSHIALQALLLYREKGARAEGGILLPTFSKQSLEPIALQALLLYREKGARAGRVLFPSMFLEPAAVFWARFLRTVTAVLKDQADPYFVLTGSGYRLCMIAQSFYVYESGKMVVKWTSVCYTMCCKKR